MQITAETPTIAATVAGFTVSMPQPFATGYALAANEAAAMNQLVIENLRNNIASRAKKDSDAGKPWDEAKVQAELSTYATTYQFGIRIGGTRSVDPIQRLMEEMAKAKAIQLLKAKGYKINTVNKEKMAEFIAKILSLDVAGDNSIRKEAERRVKADTKLAAAALEF